MTMTEPPVFIILLNWNGWRDTLDCLASLKQLRYSNYKIVIVDNASSNDSVQRISDVYADLTILLSPANLGFAGGNNIGIEYALQNGAEYIWLLNNDTVVSSAALTELVRVAEKDPSVGAVGSSILDFDPPHNVQAWGGGRISFLTGRAWHLIQPGKIDYITGASLLLRASALKQVGLLDDGFFMYWEDADLSFRLRSLDQQLAVADSSRVYHKESVSLGKKSPLMDIYFSRSAVRFFSRHSRISFLPLLFSTSGRVMKRVYEGNLYRAKITLWETLSTLFSGRNPSRRR